VVFAAAAQLLTAAMTRFMLGKRLLRGQPIAVSWILRNVTSDAPEHPNLPGLSGQAPFMRRCLLSSVLSAAMRTVGRRRSVILPVLLNQVVLVCVGICLRGVAFGASAPAAKGSSNWAADGQLWGLAAMLTSALGYSLLGVLYDLLLSTEAPPPTHAEVMQYTSKLGALAQRPSSLWL